MGNTNTEPLRALFGRYTETIMGMWTIYKHPDDYPNSYVARLFVVGDDGIRATPSVTLSKDLEAIRRVMRDEFHLVCLGRMQDDDPAIVEVWI